jgi:hypothetical protein
MKGSNRRMTTPISKYKNPATIPHCKLDDRKCYHTKKINLVGQISNINEVIEF